MQILREITEPWFLASDCYMKTYYHKSLEQVWLDAVSHTDVGVVHGVQ